MDALLILPQKWDRTLCGRRPENLSNLKLSVQPFDRHSVSAFILRFCGQDIHQGVSVGGLTD